MKNFNSIRNSGLMILLILMSSLYSLKTYSQCQAAFTWAQTSNNVITFTNTSTDPDSLVSYSWNYGDGGYGYTQNPVYTFDVPGTYYVCLYIYNQDSMNNFCSSSWCDSVTVTGVVICNLSASTYVNSLASCGNCADGSATVYSSGGTAPYSYLWSNSETTQTVNDLLPGTYNVCITDMNNCSACASVTIDTCSLHSAFTWAQTSNNTITFTNTSTGTTNMTEYQWNFGDGNYDFTQNPVHFYSNPGTYQICLMLTDSLNIQSCTSNFCDSVVVTGLACNNLSISANVIGVTCNNCNNGSISAIVSGGNPPFTYAWTPNVSTTSSASNLSIGNYQVCVTDSIGCSACTNAQIYLDTMNNNCAAYFTLYPDTTQAHTYIAVNYSTGPPPLSYTWSWGDGSYSYIEYPSHTYANAGMYTICLTISDSIYGCSNTYCVSDSIMRTSNSMIYITVIAPTSSGIQSVQSLSNWSVYPNPAADNFTIDYSLSSSSSVVINLYDMLGNRIKQVENSKQAMGEHTISVNTATLPEGIYLLQINSGNIVSNKKISVIK
jgi:PKD repeat protein